MPPQHQRQGPAAVTVSDLSAGYPGRSVLQDVNARIPQGRITAVVGPNGSGKSTLLGVLAGVVRPTGGSLRAHTAGRPAFVVQRSAASDALPLTVGETVAMGRWAQRGPWRRLSERDRSVVASCLSRLGILDLAARQLGALSGGQRQRALVAQGLAQESGLLLLDEPAAGLDMAARQRIREVLREETDLRGVTVVHVTHDFDEAMRADHCLLLGGGRLIAEGPPGAVLTHDALERAWGTPRPRTSQSQRVSGV